MLTRWPGTRVMSRLPWHLLVLPRGTHAREPANEPCLDRRASVPRAGASKDTKRRDLLAFFAWGGGCASDAMRRRPCVPSLCSQHSAADDPPSSTSPRHGVLVPPYRGLPGQWVWRHPPATGPFFLSLLHCVPLSLELVRGLLSASDPDCIRWEQAGRLAWRGPTRARTRS